jgi:hypothetical protein
VAAIFANDKSEGLSAAMLLHDLGMPHSDKPAETSVVKALKEIGWWRWK